MYSNAKATTEAMGHSQDESVSRRTNARPLYWFCNAAIRPSNSARSRVS